MAEFARNQGSNSFADRFASDSIHSMPLTYIFLYYVAQGLDGTRNLLCSLWW